MLPSQFCGCKVLSLRQGDIMARSAARFHSLLVVDIISDLQFQLFPAHDLISYVQFLPSEDRSCRMPLPPFRNRPKLRRMHSADVLYRRLRDDVAGSCATAVQAFPGKARVPRPTGSTVRATTRRHHFSRSFAIGSTSSSGYILNDTRCGTDTGDR